MKIISFFDKVIEYSFYLIFLLVPLAFTGDNFELFEFNKMWLTFGFSLLIAGAWFSKMILQRKISIRRTPLDIPILLFLISQIISTIFSWDRHVSFWGYYSRFNGGLLSIITYIFLYYAFVSNFIGRENGGIKIVRRSIFISLISGALVALWGLPSHFGFDPTCFIFRGNFDVSCWTEAFQPKVRIFSTLGQPDWLAAYLLILIPVIVAFLIKILNNSKCSWKLEIGNWKLVVTSLLLAVFYADLLFTRSKSAFLALGVSLLFFIIAYLWKEKDSLLKLAPKKILSSYKSLVTVLILILVVTFFAQTPFDQLNKLTFSGIKNSLQKSSVSKNNPKSNPTPAVVGEFGGTDSGKIRLIVWEGAIDAWLHNPLFGTGVETFAFAYYKYRPVAHNLTSEWDYLYNKAHNEYLNYLTTTGAFGLGTYLAIIVLFLFVSIKKLLSSKLENWKLVVIGLLAAYISILIVNFFGFSVVIVNIYFFLIPAFFFILTGLLDNQKDLVLPKEVNTGKKLQKKVFYVSHFQWLGVLFVVGVSLYFIMNLFRFWSADKAYALGYNLDRVGQYQEAYVKLKDAISQRPGEPVFQDEMSINDGILATALVMQKQASLSAILAQDAVSTSDNVVKENANNVVFWKTRVRLFYTLSQADPKYLPLALDAIKKASALAPTDAKISYNLGVLYGQNGDSKKAVEVLEKTIKLKPNYGEAYYALGLFYHDLGVNKGGVVTDPEMAQKAIDTMHYILKNIDPEDKQAKSALKSWGVE